MKILKYNFFVKMFKGLFANEVLTDPLTFYPLLGT